MAEMRNPKLGYETKALLEALMKTHFEENLRIGNWKFTKVGIDLYRIEYVGVANGGIVMTAADVVTQLSIPFDHEWVRIGFYHTTAAGVASVDATFVNIARPAGTIPPLALFVETLFREYDITASSITEVFGAEFQYEKGTWNITLNTTATNLVFPVFYVRRLK
jgi:hypothetical protein